MGRKQPNPMPPVSVNVSNTRKRMILIFNEWNRRYIENPDDFADNVDIDGSPAKDYGELCAEYFYYLAHEMDEKNFLPKI